MEIRRERAVAGERERDTWQMLVVVVVAAVVLIEFV